MTILAGYVALNAAVAGILYRYRNRSLHPVEILVYWLAATILFQNYTAFFTMNAKLMTIPDNLPLELSHLLNRTVLYPLLGILFLTRYVQTNKIGRSIWTILAFGAFLGLEWLADALGVLAHAPQWKLWWSMLYWAAFLAIYISFMEGFRRVFSKELRYE
jgi:hypothetical protein